MKTRKIVFLMLILAMLIGVSYATEASNDTATTDTHEPIVKNNSNTKTADNIIKEDNSNKEIVKKTNVNQTTKTASKTININNDQTLYDSLNVINIKL